MSAYLLDYGGGNVRSVLNAFKSLGHNLSVVATPEDILRAEKLVFPGVGAFGSCTKALRAKGYVEPLKK